MGSEGDARGDDTRRVRSEFGPPVHDSAAGGNEKDSAASGFGPPVTGSDDQPARSAFGAPIGPGHIPGWQPPAGSRPEVGWRPAGGLLPPGGSGASGGLDAGSRAPGAAEERATASRGSGAFGAPVTGEVNAEEPTVRHQVAKAPETERWWSGSEDGGVPKPPADSEGLAWSDDPIARRLAPGGSAPQEPAPRTSRTALYGAVAAALALVAAIVVIVVTTGGDERTAAPAAPSTAALSCPATSDGNVTVGNSDGGTGSGTEAILGFQYAFYVERDGDRARTFVASDAENVSTAEVIQQAIDEQIPVGTTHCLRITELATDTFEVDLTEHRPDGTTTVYRQTVTTVERDGKHLVHAIDER